MRYGLLKDLPTSEWPPEAKAYAIEDAVEHLDVFLDQCRDVARRVRNEDRGFDDDTTQGSAFVPDEIAQTRAAFALGLLEVWGLRTA